MEVFNPYSFDFGNTLRVPAISHQHCENQSQFDRIVESGMYQIYAISNYYPSEPIYPLSDKFTNIPVDAISCPNAEHHNFSTPSLHINGLGSTFSSGSPEGEQPKGMDGKTWQEGFGLILGGLLYNDAGGLTINHPTWSNSQQYPSNLNVAFISQMLDYDTDRVLGLEIYNANTPEYNLSLWDDVLNTGRRCWGFGASDHIGQYNGVPSGRNVLFVDEATTYKCLKAYRDGAFYVQIGKTALTFNSISLNGKLLTVSASLADYINIVIDGIATRYDSTVVNVGIPDNAKFVRVEAFSSNDAIYSQPILFKNWKKTRMFSRLMPFIS